MIFRFLTFLLLFYLVYSLVKRMFPSPISKMPGSGNQSRASNGEGDVSINFNPHKDKSASHRVGEYVDYEEVE